MNILWIVLVILGLVAQDQKEESESTETNVSVTIQPTYKPVQSQKIKSFVQIVVKKNACSYCGSTSYPRS